MKKITQLIVKKTIPNYNDTENQDVRYGYGALEGWVSIIGNLILCVAKLFAGIYINSAALITDAIHTLSDSLSSVVIIFGFAMAKKPSDKEHPFGHGRMESVAALIIAILLCVAGIELLKFSIDRMQNPTVSGTSLYVILFVLSTIVAKEIMARFSYELGDMIDSKALKADALHHRTDAVTTLLVIVALVGSRFGYPNLDGIMGIIVSIIICYSAFIIAKDAISPLIGEAPSQELLDQIKSVVHGREDVIGVHDIICHFYGHVRIISLHLEVSSEESALALHTLAESVEKEIASRTNSLVIVHIDPINSNHPQYNAIHKTVKSIVDRDDRIHSFHDMRIIGEDGGSTPNVMFDVVLNPEFHEENGPEIAASIKREMVKKFPLIKVTIKIDPLYSYNPQS